MISVVFTIRGAFIMKKKISLILIILGLILILIPIGGNIYNKNKQDEMIRDFEETFQTVSSTDEGEPLKEGEFVIVDINSNDNSKIDIGSVIGIIHIPRIELTLPLMEGTTEKVLLQAIGHMKETPMPGQIGNAAFAGHRSHTFSRFFNRLGELGLLDEVYIKTKTTQQKYEVYDILIVKPTDIHVLGPDLDVPTITLITCHPMYSNKQRLIVKAKLIEEKPLSEIK